MYALSVAADVALTATTNASEEAVGLVPFWLGVPTVNTDWPITKSGRSWSVCRNGVGKRRTRLLVESTT